MSIEPQRSTTSSTSDWTDASSATSAVEADAVRERLRRRLGPLEVGDDDARARGREPVGDRVADALRPAGDDRDLAVELTHRCPSYWIAENGVGVRIRFCWVWINGWILPMNAFQSSRAWRAARRSSRSAKLS